MKRIRIFLIFSYALLAASAANAQSYAFQGSWINHTEDRNAEGAPCFRREFQIRKPIRKATAYVCGVGYQLTRLNGKPVTDAVLEQAFSCYDVRLLYQTYEVTKFLKFGANAIGVELGNGWYNMQSHTIWNFDKIAWRKSPRLLLNLVINYQDGSSDTLKTDDSWKSLTGPDRFNSLPAGEIYDARSELPGWDKAGYPDQYWAAAKITHGPGGRLEPQTMPAVKVIKRLRPVSLRKIKGKWLFDLGENFAGVVTLRVRGKAGDTVKLVYDELLNKDGSLHTVQNSGQMIVDQPEPKFQTDIYVLKGGGIETFTPHFTYHGFQYVQVSAPKHIQLNKASITGLFYSTGFKPIGSFSCDNPMLNKLYQAAIRSYRSNFVGIPTDCPQREKMGWLADAHFGAELGLWNFEAAEAYKAYLRNVRDVMLPDGKLPGVAPIRGIGYRWFDPADDDFGPIWGSALPILSWYIYHYTGDRSVIKENYAACKLYADYLTRRAEKTGWLYTTGLADWQALEVTPKVMTSTALYYDNLYLMAKMANITNQPDPYTALAAKVKAAYNARFYDSVQHKYRNQTMTALGISLYYGLCPAGEESRVAALLATELKNRNYAVDFGILGTKTILSALADHGYAEVVYRLLTNTKTGWAKWIAAGSTTLWEEWPGTTSHNHVYSGDYVNWYFRYLGGIRLLEHSPGFTYFLIKPLFLKSLRHVTVTHRGISVKWQRGNHRIALTIVVPPKSTARLQIPGKEKELAAGTYHFNCLDETP